MDSLGAYPSLAQAWPKLGTRFAFEPLLCKRPQKPSLRDQNQRCTVRESRNFPTCTNSSRPATMTSRLSGRTASKKRTGYWRGFVDNVVLRYLDCGVPEGGFARVVCEDCSSEFLLCFSCKARSLCPSCDAKRAAAFAAFLQEELLEDVGHAVWSFSIPKMLRRYFLFHRELLTELARAGYETVHELLAAAVDDNNVRVGMVASIQTFSDNLVWDPHLHCIVSRGVWRADGQWIPVPYIDTHAAEILFREKVFRLLQEHDLLSDECIKILRSWRWS